MPARPGRARDEAACALAEAVLQQPGQYGRHVVVAALAALATAALDGGRPREALELLRDAARHATAVSPDARHVQPLLVLAAALVDLRQLEEAEATLEAAAGRALRALPAQAAASIVRARISLARGRLGDAGAAAGRALAEAEALGAHGYASAARSVLSVIALRGGDVMSAARPPGQRPGSRPAPGRGVRAGGGRHGPGPGQRGTRRPGAGRAAAPPGLRRPGNAPGAASRRPGRGGVADARRAGRG